MSDRQAVGAVPSPWNARERLLLGVLLAVGVLGLSAGYAGTSGTLRVSRQVAWLNLAGAALVVSGVGVVWFLTTGRRAIGRRRLGLFGNLDEAGVAGEVDLASADAGELVAAATMTRYHRADCSFVADKTGVMAASAAMHEQAGRHPCGVCLAAPSGITPEVPGGDA